MKLKMKLMAAAVALAASAGANAAMDNIQSGNSSLAFIAIDSTGSPISMMMDLDFNLNSFLPAAMSASGTTIQWNFGANSLTVNGVLSNSTQTNWSGALGSFNAIAQTTETKWGVIAGDSATTRYLTTVVAGTPITTVDNTTKGNLTQFSLADNLYGAQNLLQVGGINGSTASSGDGYVGQSYGFGTTLSRGWQNRIATSVVTLADVGSNADFYLYDTTSPGGGTAPAKVTPYAGTFNYAAGVLTYTVAAVPEPSEYALMLAGLGMIGFMARRRLNHRA